MRRRWRWGVVTAVVAAFVAAPLIVRVLPVADSSVDARTLLARIRSSANVAWSGYAESTGGLALPVTADQFSVVNDLFGGRTQLRVWWRGTTDWRVDSIGLTGETDIHADRTGIWTWNYEANTARRVPAPGPSQHSTVRLPRFDDLVPAGLARRLLSEADPRAVSRLPSARIAGQDAAGLRLTVRDRRSTVRHVDVWALPGDGLPVRAAVYGDDAAPIVSSTLLDLSTSRPAANTTAFPGAPGERVSDGQFDDIVSVIDRYGRSQPPSSVAGLPRRRDLDLGAVGVYGHSVDLLAAVPLSAQMARNVVPQLRGTPGAVEDGSGIAVAVGPLNLQLSPPAGFGARWLLVGTLTRATLRAAVQHLPPARGFGFD